MSQSLKVSSKIRKNLRFFLILKIRKMRIVVLRYIIDSASRAMDDNNAVDVHAWKTANS